MTTRTLFSRLTVVSLILTLAVTPSFASLTRAADVPAPATIRLGVFASSLPLRVAEQKGFFAEQNLTVQLQFVTSSTQQFQYLRDGLYDMISTSPDNVVNYRLNPHNALNTLINGKIISGTGYGGNLTLVGQPGMTSLADFRGRSMALDSTVSGFAYVMYKMLKNVGLTKDVDYTVVPCGGGTQRLQALINGHCNGIPITGGALLSGGAELTAQGMGFRLLKTIQDVPNLNPYLGGIVAAKEDWLAANSGVAIRFTAALLKATEWSLDPANRTEAIQILLPIVGNSLPAAERSYNQAVAPNIGLIPGMEIDRQGLRTVLELRHEFGGFEQPQNIHFLSTPASGLYDTYYLRKAEKLLRK